MVKPVDRGNAGKVWLPEEDAELLRRYSLGLTPEELADAHGRMVNAILGRLCRLGLVVAQGTAYYKVSADPWISFAEVRDIRARERMEEPK